MTFEEYLAQYPPAVLWYQNLSPDARLVTRARIIETLNNGRCVEIPLTNSINLYADNDTPIRQPFVTITLYPGPERIDEMPRDTVRNAMFATLYGGNSDRNFVSEQATAEPVPEVTTQYMAQAETEIRRRMESLRRDIDASCMAPVGTVDPVAPAAYPEPVPTRAPSLQTARRRTAASFEEVRRRYRCFTLYFPYHSFKKCAECMDTPDLRRTQVAVLRYLKYLSRPAVDNTQSNRRTGRYNQMVEKWRDYQQALIRYGIYVAEEYVRRGGSRKVLEILREKIVYGEWIKPDFIFLETYHKDDRRALFLLGTKRQITHIFHQLSRSRRSDYYGRTVSGILHDFVGSRHWRDLSSYSVYDLLHTVRSSRYGQWVSDFGANFYSRHNWQISEDE